MAPGDNQDDASDDKPLIEGKYAGSAEPVQDFDEELPGTPSYIRDGIGASWLGEFPDADAKPTKGEEDGADASAEFRTAYDSLNQDDEEAGSEDGSANDSRLVNTTEREVSPDIDDDSGDDDNASGSGSGILNTVEREAANPDELDADESDSAESDEGDSAEGDESDAPAGEKTITEEPPSPQSPEATEIVAPPSSGSGTGGVRRFKTTRYGSNAGVVVGLSAWKRGAPLGAGGQGEVYAGKHELSGLEVAIKTVRVTSHKTGSSTDSALNLLLKEAQALAQFQHPNIVRLLDFQEIEREPSKMDRLNLLETALDKKTMKRLAGRERQDAMMDIYAKLDDLNRSGPLEYMMVMECMKGGSLLGKMTKKVKDADGVEQKIVEPMNANDAVNIIRKIGTGLQAVHSKGVLHRDIKPENIMFDENGEPKLGDFGLTFGLEQKAQGIAGSPYYLSPEQAMNGATLDVRTDVYLLAATLYHALVGRWRLHDELEGKYETEDGKGYKRPSELHPAVIVKKVLETYQLRSVVYSRADLGERGADLSAVVMKGLSFDPANRYASVDEFCADLARWQNDELVQARLNPDSEARLIRANKFAKDNIGDVAERARFMDLVRNEIAALPYTKAEDRANRWRKGGRRKTIVWSAIGSAALVVGGLLYGYGASTYERIIAERERRAQAAERRSALESMQEEIQGGVARVSSASSIASVNELSEKIERAYLFSIENREVIAEAKSAVSDLEARRSWIQSQRLDMTERDRVNQILAGVAVVGSGTVFDSAQRTVDAYRSVKDGSSLYARSAQVNLLVRLDRSVADVHTAVHARYAGISQIDSAVLTEVRGQVSRAQSVLGAADEVRGVQSYADELRTLNSWAQALASAYQGQIEESFRNQQSVESAPLRDVLLSGGEEQVRRFGERAEREVLELESRVKHGAAALAQYQAAVRADPSWVVVAERREVLAGLQAQDEQRLALVRGSAQVSAGILQYHRALREERFGDAFRKLSEVYGTWPERVVLDLMEQVKDRDKAQMMRRAFVGMQDVLDYGAEVRALYDSYYLNEFDGAELELGAAARTIQSRLERKLRPEQEQTSRRLPDDVYEGLMERSRSLEASARDSSQRRFGQVRINEIERARREAQGVALDRQFEAGALDYEGYMRERSRLRESAQGNRSSGPK